MRVENRSSFPIYVKVGIKQSDRRKSEEQPNDSFFSQLLIKAQNIVGSEKYAEVGMNCDYVIDKYSQAYGEAVSGFEVLTSKRIFQLFITQSDFEIGNDKKGAENKLYLFDLRNHKEYSSPSPIKILFSVSEFVPENIVDGFASVLEKKEHL